MGRKSQFTKEGKIKIIQRYDNDEGPQETLGKEISADNKTIKNWIDRYHAYGEGLSRKVCKLFLNVIYC